MSTGAIQQVADELRELPESDQNLVLGFLRTLKRHRKTSAAPVPRRGRNPALKLIDGALVFAGELSSPQADWLQVVRDEHETEIMGLASDAATA